MGGAEWVAIANEKLFPYTSNQIAYDEIKESILAAIMTSIGHPLTKRRCPLCVKDAIDTLKREERKIMAKKKSGSSRSKYRLKDIRVGVLGYSITQAECTDDIARKILRRNVAFIAFFERYPSDWAEDIKASESKETTTDVIESNGNDS